jgi:hypothetical protein
MPSDAAAALWKALCMDADAHPRRTGRKVRLKASERCKEMIEALGVTDVRVSANKGYWSHRQQDCYRWEFTGKRADAPSLSVTGGCYDSMTDCAKPGVHLEWLPEYFAGSTKKEFTGEVCAVKK